MSLVIAVSSLSERAIGRCNAGVLHGSLHPFLGDGTVGRKIGGLGLFLLAEKRQMRLEVVIARRQPFAPVSERGGSFLTGIEEVGNKILVLDPRVVAAGLDRIVIGSREFWILESQIDVAQKRLPRADGAIAGADLVDLEQDRHEAEQRHARLRHLRQRPVSLPPENARLRHRPHSAATICAGSRMPASSISALREYSSMRSSISWRKCAIKPWIGQAAASPSAQMVWPSTCFVTSSSMSISRLWARPSAILVSTRHIQPVPSRHGVHWPQLSCL